MKQICCGKEFDWKRDDMERMFLPPCDCQESKDAEIHIESMMVVGIDEILAGTVGQRQ